MSEPHTADLATRYRYREEGREFERERIIKLLEENSDCQNQCYYGDCCCKAIALIKGEQK